MVIGVTHVLLALFGVAVGIVFGAVKHNKQMEEYGNDKDCVLR